MPVEPPFTPPIGYSLAIGLLVLIAAAKPILFDTLDPDCFWHLRVAQSLLDQGIGPIVDDLTFTAGDRPWTPYSWLAELFMLGVWNLAGWRGAVIVNALCNAAFVGLIAACCRAVQPVQPQRWFNTLLATAMASVWSLAYLSFRPATFAIVLLALLAWLLLLDRRRAGRLVWAVVPLTFLLTNLHLTAILVPMWTGCLLLGAIVERRREDIRRYAALTALCTLALCATPMLSGVIAAIGSYQSQDVMVASGLIAEMRPFYAGPAGKLSLLLVLITLAGVIARRRQLRPGELLWLALMLLLLLRLGRFAPLFAIIAAPLASITLPRLSDLVLTRRPIVAALAILLAVGTWRVIRNTPAAHTPLDQWLNRHDPQAPYPTAAARFIAEHLPARNGRLINDFNTGGYLAWRLAGQYQTLLDGRTQIHPAAFWQAAYLSDRASRSALLQQARANAAVLSRHDQHFAPLLKESGWHTAWQDRSTQVLVPPKRPDLAAVPLP